MTYEDINTNLTEELTGLNEISKTPSIVHGILDALIKQRLPSTSGKWRRTVNSSRAFQYRCGDKMRTFETRRTIMH